MAISFLPIRDQNAVGANMKKTASAKGALLQRISSGKKISSPRDGVSEFRQLDNLKNTVEEIQNRISLFANYRSVLEISLEATDLLREQYKEMKSLIKSVPTDLDTTKDKDELESYQVSLTEIVNTIKNIYEHTDFLNEKIFEKPYDYKIDSNNPPTKTLEQAEKENKSYVSASNPIAYATPQVTINGKTVTIDDNAANLFKTKTFLLNGDATAEMSLKNLRIPRILKVTTDELKKLFSGTGNLYDKFKVKSNTTGEDVYFKDELLNNIESAIEGTYSNTSIISLTMNQIDVAEDIMNVQVTNYEASISAIEDVDIQEEIVNLMQSQVLEELSAQALSSIKESARYLVKLIQS